MGTDDLYRVGNGPHAVLGLHGWFGAAQAWQTLAPYLDGSRFSYYFLDYRGYGSRMGEQGQYTVAEAASDAIATADQLDLQRYSVLGHSMGGSVMQQVLMQARTGSGPSSASHPCLPVVSRSTTTAGRCSPAPPRSRATAARSSTSPRATG